LLCIFNLNDGGEGGYIWTATLNIRLG